MVPNLQCVAACATREAIIRRDAEHKEDTIPTPTQQDILSILSDAVIALEHSIILVIDTATKKALIELLSKPDSQINAFFSDDSQELKQLCNTIFSRIFSFISTSEPFTTATGGGHLHLEASHQIAESITNSLFLTILKHKDVFRYSVLSPVKYDSQTKPLVELIIHGSNYDNVWKEAIFTLNVGKSLVSPNSLALKIATIEEKVKEQQHNHTEIDHQVTKIATRLGDLKTFEMEQRFKVLENELKIHNINYIDEGTGNHFKSLNSNQQIKRVQKLVSDHLTNKNASFSAKVISPRTGSKYFEAHATIKFSSTVHKFEFEKNFSNYRRNNPGCKLFTSRPVPKPTHSDRDLPDISDIKTRIGMMYNQAVFLARHKNPDITFKELSENEVDAIKVTLK